MLFGLLLQAAPAAAHLVLAHPAQYGRNGPNLHPVTPQRGQKFDEWWFKGNLNYPPKEGVVMDLPAGDKITLAFTCSNGTPKPSYTGYTCGNNLTDNGSTHTKDKMNTPIDQIVDVRGTGIAIAYESDATKIQPEDFAVFTVNYSCPWVLGCDFHVPQNMPPCPPGGCTCMWGWIHSPNAGGQPEMYTMGYRCNITGATATAPIPPPKVARKCPINKNNCTVGAKQLHYWIQAERNNNFQAVSDPPFYNGDYGFMDGAQTDLWDEGDESLYADNCDWAPGPQLYDGVWSNLVAGRPQWDGVPLTPLPRVYPTPVNCTSTKTATSSVMSSTAAASSIAAFSSAAVASASSVISSEAVSPTDVTSAIAASSAFAAISGASAASGSSSYTDSSIVPTGAPASSVSASPYISGSSAAEPTDALDPDVSGANDATATASSTVGQPSASDAPAAEDSAVEGGPTSASTAPADAQSHAAKKCANKRRSRKRHF